MRTELVWDVYNLGRYERQWWQQERLQGADTEHRRVILEFFKAEAFCHLDGIDLLFTREEAKQVTQAGGRECYCAWEFEMDLTLFVNFGQADDDATAIDSLNDRKLADQELKIWIEALHMIGK
jgi:hypothetical protein